MIGDTAARRPGDGRLRFFLRMGSTVAMLSLVWTLAGGGDSLARLASANIGWIALAFVTVNIQTMLSARRWQITAAPLGLRIGLWRAISEYYLSQLVNQALPGGILGDAGRAVRSRHAADLPRAAQAVVIERLLGQVALLAVFALGIVLLATGTGHASLLDPATGLLSLALLAAGAAVLAGGLALLWVPRLRLVAWSAARILRGCIVSEGLWLRQGSLSIAIAVCNIMAFALCFRATGSVLPAGVALVLIPLILLAMLVPLTVGGWGLREGTAAALFPLAGGTAEAGLAASVAFGLVLLVSALPGAIALFRPARTMA